MKVNWKTKFISCVLGGCSKSQFSFFNDFTYLKLEETFIGEDLRFPILSMLHLKKIRPNYKGKNRSLRLVISM